MPATPRVQELYSWRRLGGGDSSVLPLSFSIQHLPTLSNTQSLSSCPLDSLEIGENDFVLQAFSYMEIVHNKELRDFSYTEIEKMKKESEWLHQQLTEKKREMKQNDEHLKYATKSWLVQLMRCATPSRGFKK
jgi:hypothetical protein